MREQGKRSIRSAGYVDRHVIVHRSADRGALRLCARTPGSLLAWEAAAASSAALLRAGKKLRLPSLHVFFFSSSSLLV